MEVFGHVAIFNVGKLPTSERLGTLGGVSAQTILALEAGSNRIDNNTVSFLKTVNCAAKLVDHSYGLMPEGEVCPFSDRPGHRVRI
jgi:hypothetical protein